MRRKGLRCIIIHRLGGGIVKFPTIEEFGKQVAERAKEKLEVNDMPLTEFLVKVDEVAGFLQSEIEHCGKRYAQYDSQFYDGEKVGFEVSKRLNERHILFCKRILKMLGVDGIRQQ